MAQVLKTIARVATGLACLAVAVFSAFISSWFAILSTSGTLTCDAGAMEGAKSLGLLALAGACSWIAISTLPKSEKPGVGMAPGVLLAILSLIPAAAYLGSAVYGETCRGSMAYLVLGILGLAMFAISTWMAIRSAGELDVSNRARRSQSHS